MSAPLVCQACGRPRESVAHPVCDACRQGRQQLVPATPELRVLLLEPCPRCGRAQTAIYKPGAAAQPTCVCCGGHGLDRDRACRHLARPESSR